MIRIHDKEEEEERPDQISISRLESAANQSESNKQIHRPKSSSSSSSSSSFNSSYCNGKHVHQHRRVASESHELTRQSPATFLVTSFLQYLRNQLRATTNNRTNEFHSFTRQNLTSNIQLKMSNETNDENEIMTLIDLLVLRVECLTNEHQSSKRREKKKVNENYPSVNEVDENLIEYLYYLFTKFIHDNHQTNPIVDKCNFVNVCQTLVRHGCFDMPSPEHSLADTTSTEQTVNVDDNDTCLAGDFEATKENLIIPSALSDEQFLSSNENDKSYESFSSSSVYLSPNGSSIDLHESIEHNHSDDMPTYGICDSKTAVFNENICIGLTNDCDSNETNQQMTIEFSEQMSQREKKMQDRWTRSITTDVNQQSPVKPLLDIDFPSISVLRRKFSATNKEINASSSTAMLLDNMNPEQINQSPSIDLSSTNILVELESNNVEQDALSDCDSDTIKNLNETSSSTLTNQTSDSSILLSLSSINAMNTTIEPIEKENEHVYNLDEEKKNNSRFVYGKHASGILLINDEPTQTALLVGEQEKKEDDEEQEEKKSEEERERPSPTLQTLEQFKQQRTEDDDDEDESTKSILSNNIQQLNRTNMTDNSECYKKIEIEEISDDDEDKILAANTIDLTIQPIDFIRTDDEKQSTTTTLIKTKNNDEQLLSCYEKAFSKIVERNFDDSSTSIPSATVDDPIALRALQRFEQRMNAVSTKAINDDSSASKGKSSWTGSMSTQRKSMENLLRTTEPTQVRSNAEPVNAEILTTNDDSNNNVEQPQTTTPVLVETDDKQVVEKIFDDKSNAIEHSGSVDDSNLGPYRFQIEGRRRLNTIDRLRERRQSRELLEQSNDKQQIQTECSIQTNDIQDPIIRRALERFDEQNRTLTQTKSMNYDDIQDPITRRALMRLESNLKRTLPTTTNEHFYTENYTLGSLQPTTSKAKYVSVHQHYCAPSSNQSTDVNCQHPEQDLSVHRSTAQPIYLTSANQPLSVRQRSRSEDMLSSKDLTIGQTTNLDELDTSTNHLQRNRSSNEIAVNEPNRLLPTTFIKTLEPTFVRTTESSVSYVTPTQTYSAYSCEYTRPKRSPIVSSTETFNTNHNQKQLTTISKCSTIENDIQHQTSYRPIDTSTYIPMQTSTTNYYNHQPISSSTNHFHQTSTSEDPIIRRALDRFNSQMQNSYHSRSNPTATDAYLTSNRNNRMATSTTSGYQSIIGRRRQIRHDETNQYFVDNPTVGDGYTSSYFINSQNSYPTPNQYVEFAEQPPAIPPRYRRLDDTYDHYRRHSTDEFLSDNYNNNNNNNNCQTLPRETFIHHAYPATITNSNAFRPITVHYNQDEYLDRAHSASSTNSSESFQRLRQPIKLQSSDSSMLDGTSSSDSGFHRLAYTGTKTSLSKSSSNLLNKNPPANQIQTCEIDLDESISAEQNLANNKYHRSRSVDPRARLKLAQTRADNELIEHDDQPTRHVPSTKFTPVHSRPPPRVPLTPATMPRKHSSNASQVSYSKHEHQSHDMENNENIQYDEDNRMKTTIPVQRYTNNQIQTSTSTSSINSNLSRTKPPVTIPMNFERRESNGSIVDGNKVSRRSDDHRLVSPGGQRRNIPVSVFQPAKIENKRPAPAPPVSNCESQQTIGNDQQLKATNPKTSTNTYLVNEYTLTQQEKSDNPKKMNVFERLFRGNKKKT